MATNTQISLIPDMPRDSQVVDQNGQLTSHWRLYFDQLTQSLQRIVSNEGMIMPPLTTTSITALTGAQSLGAIVFNTTTGEFQGNIATNTWKTFTLT